MDAGVPGGKSLSPFHFYLNDDVVNVIPIDRSKLNCGDA